MREVEKDNAALSVSRKKTIVRTSVIGIAANVFLATFKAIVGILSNSIAITLDAVNNISDAASSVITIIGARLAGKAPDRKHPFGHGRAEYLAAMIISVIVLYAGVTALVESVKKIITPVTPDYSYISLIVVGVAVIVKIFLGIFVKRTGERVKSDSLVNSGQDAKLDAVISASTLVAAVVFIKTGFSLEAWLGAAISLIIIKAGIDMLRTGISSILGERADASLSKAIKETVCSFENVFGAYDLVLNDYGPDTFLGSVHIEVPDTYSANELDELIREITEKVYIEHNVILTAVGVYSANVTDEYVVNARKDVEQIACSFDYVLQLHGFYISEEKKKMRFDVVISFDAPDRNAVFENVVNAVKEKYPGFDIQAVLDADFSES